MTAMRTLPHVDRVGVAERVAALGKRSIKGEAKRQGLLLAVSLLDLTTLEGADTPGKVKQLAAKAVTPAPAFPEVPSCAAVCVYPSMVPVARDAVAGSGVAVASVATGFPAGQTPLETRLEEVRLAVAAGADEIDMVISRDAYLRGDDVQVAGEIEAIKDACGPAHLKVILETAELGSLDHVRHASMLAMDAGADFIKTSTGKAPGGGATPATILVMLEAIRDYVDRTGRVVGMKPAGGVSNSKAALGVLVLVKETLGDEWLTPERLRIGASSVLNDLLMQYAKTESGRYGRAEDFSKE
jgi:deoxyribose-phosphate aldolase